MGWLEKVKIKLNLIQVVVEVEVEVRVYPELYFFWKGGVGGWVEWVVGESKDKAKLNFSCS